MQTMLTKIDTAKRALVQANTLPEVVNIRGQAEALRYLAKQAKLGLEQQNEIAEVKIRAERKAGELLNELIPACGGRPKNRATDSGFSSRPTLAELGIKPHQSRNWRLEASIPEDIFNLYVAYIKHSEKELTSASVQQLARRLRRQSADRAVPVNESPSSASQTAPEPSSFLYKDNWFTIWDGNTPQPFMVLDNALALVVSNGVSSRCYVLEPAQGFELYFGQSV
jgi:hypothetical protein